MSEAERLLPRLSIIIATHNAAGTLERALESIAAQTFTSWELLIADGGSKDATPDIIRRHQGMVYYWHSHPDAGIYDAWNQALVHARGEYVCFLGADDCFAEATSLARLFDAVGAAGYDLVTSRGGVFDPATGSKVDFGAPWDYRRVGRRMIVCHPGMLHRRELFARYGNFDASYRIAGDLEFLLRLPPDMSTLDVDLETVLIEAAGISRRNVMKRLAEQRRALSGSPRHGPLYAWLCWLDKLWRYPIARLFGIPH